MIVIDMAIQANSDAISFLNGLISQGKIDTDSSWSFSADDGNSLLGENNDDWGNFSKYHLAIDTEENPETKARYKFPVGKNGMVYRSGLIAAKQRAGGEDYQNILDVADEMLQKIDSEKSVAETIKLLMVEWGDKLLGRKQLDVANMIVDQPQFKLYKQTDGQYRWIGIVTNKFEDREKEILTDSAHVEFYNYLVENPQNAPELWVWHVPQTARQNKADWWEYKNGFFVYSGLLTQDEAQPYFDLDNKEAVGMSHGFFVLERQGKYITKYRTFEVSELSHVHAANPYTAFMIQEEIMQKKFNAEQRSFMVARIGEEAVNQLENGLEDAEKVLTDAGTNWKELNDQYEAEVAEKEAQRVAEATAELVEKVKTDVVAEVVEALNIKSLQDILQTLNTSFQEQAEKVAKIDELEEKVMALLENEDRRIAKALVPNEPFNWLHQAASKSDDTIVEDDEEATKEMNGENSEYNWLKTINLKGVF